MKRISSLVLAALLVLALSACSAAPAPATPTATAPAPAEASPAAPQEASDASCGILIAYFSVPETDGVDAVAGASRVVVDGAVLGSNQYVAQLIQAEVGGDLFRIETEQTYPGEHDALLEFAYNELAEGARPALATQVEDLSRYDVIFLGYPNWNADLPMPLYTFLESVDLSGKTILPFTVHGGSGFSRTISTIQELQPGATVIEDGLSISRNSVTEAQSAVADAVLDVPLQHDLAHAVQGGLCRVDLGEDVLTGHVLVHHAVDGLDLADDLLETAVQVFGVHTLLHCAYLPQAFGSIIRRGRRFVKPGRGKRVRPRRDWAGRARRCSSPGANCGPYR